MQSFGANVTNRAKLIRLKFITKLITVIIRLGTNLRTAVEYLPYFTLKTGMGANYCVKMPI